MISVILAEDEELEMQALSNNIDYTSIGMEIIGKAYTGDAALELIEKHRPDLLITDIVMPKLSGIELARRAKETNPDIHIIIITGHQRFDYASLAIELGVDGFLLKPVFPEKLRGLLQNAAEKISANNRRIFEETLYAQELHANLPMLRELFIRSLIDGDVPPDASKRLEYYDISFLDAPFTVFCLLAENSDNSDITLLSLRRCITSFMQKEQRGFCHTWLRTTEGEVICILFNVNPDDGDDKLGTLAKKLNAAIFTDCGASATIGASDIGNGLNEIHRCVEQASSMLKYRFYLGSGNVIFFSDVAPIKSGDDPQAIRRLFPALLVCSENGDLEELDRLCNELHTAVSSCGLPPEYLRMILAELMNSIVASGYESNISTGGVSDQIIAVLRAETSDEIIELIRNAISARIDNVSRYITGRENYLAEKILKIISTQYASNLTIDDIAKQIYVSPGYASRLFRKYTGESIGSFLTRTRMEAAAKILSNPSVSIREAAEATGYTNIAYFSSVFRKTYNCTPREYRDANIKE